MRPLPASPPADAPAPSDSAATAIATPSIRCTNLRYPRALLANRRLHRDREILGRRLRRAAAQVADRRHRRHEQRGHDEDAGRADQRWADPEQRCEWPGEDEAERLEDERPEPLVCRNARQSLTRHALLQCREPERVRDLECRGTDRRADPD